MNFSIQNPETLNHDIHFGTSLKLFKKALDEHRIVNGTRTLAQELFRLGAKNWNDNNANYDRSKGVYIKTRRKSLANSCGSVCKNTVKNQLKRLEKKMLITVCGTGYDMYVRIKPSIIFCTESVQNFTPLVYTNLDINKEHINKYNKDVDNSSLLKNTKKGDGACIDPQFENIKDSQAPPFTYYTNLFFAKVQEHLYPQYTFNRLKGEKIKKLIQDEVLIENFDSKEQTFDFNYRVLLDIEHWLSKRPTFIMPDPEQYFSIKNREGFSFAKAKDWKYLELLKTEVNKNLGGNTSLDQYGLKLAEVAQQHQLQHLIPLIIHQYIKNGFQ